ncbi:MAG TPA: hypothetical protein VEX11_01220, partial [Acetobacteraceae bacterium]|nr:hypothetical protein [Acetobacteraceae bacterium]
RGASLRAPTTSQGATWSRRPSSRSSGALAADPFFKKTCDSQRDWCRRVGNFYLRYEASQAVAYNHFFARQG